MYRLRSLQRVERLAARGRMLMLADQPEDARPAVPREWFSVTNAADGDSATVLVYGDIGGWWGVDPERLVREIHSLEVKTINVHINSHGGSMFDGFSIYAALQQHPAEVISWIDGVAASAASCIAMAGKVIMEKPSRLMIHLSGIYASGNRLHLRETADLLEEFDGSIADIYADKAGKPAAEFMAAMEKETWYGSAAALDIGLADEIADHSTPAAESRTSQLIRARARVALGGVSTK